MDDKKPRRRGRPKKTEKNTDVNAAPTPKGKYRKTREKEAPVKVNNIATEPVEIIHGDKSDEYVELEKLYETLLPHEIMLRTSRSLPSPFVQQIAQPIPNDPNKRYNLLITYSLYFPSPQEAMKSQEQAAKYFAPSLQAIATKVVEDDKPTPVIAIGSQPAQTDFERQMAEQQQKLLQSAMTEVDQSDVVDDQ